MKFEKECNECTQYENDLSSLNFIFPEDEIKKIKKQVGVYDKQLASNIEKKR